MLSEVEVKVCLEPGCPALTANRRCPEHTRARDKARGTRQSRGYGPKHDRLRAKWAPLVAAGTIACARCGSTIEAGSPWDLGHDDDDRTRYVGPEHRGCNRAVASRRKTVS